MSRRDPKRRKRLGRMRSPREAAVAYLRSLSGDDRGRFFDTLAGMIQPLGDRSGSLAELLLLPEPVRRTLAYTLPLTEAEVEALRSELADAENVK